MSLLAQLCGFDNHTTIVKWEKCWWIPEDARLLPLLAEALNLNGSELENLSHSWICERLFGSEECTGQNSKTIQVGR
jgi:hypothetical protein